MSSSLIKRGWTLNRARKITMLAMALCVMPIMFAERASNMWTAIFIIGLAAAAHQGWSANLFTLVSDMFPRRAVGSVVGIGGMAGAIGGIFIASLTGHVLQWTGSYQLMFVIASGVYLTALIILQWLVPRLEPAPVDEWRGAA